MVNFMQVDEQEGNFFNLHSGEKIYNKFASYFFQSTARKTSFLHVKPLYSGLQKFVNIKKEGMAAP